MRISVLLGWDEDRTKEMCMEMRIYWDEDGNNTEDTGSE